MCNTCTGELVKLNSKVSVTSEVSLSVKKNVVQRVILSGWCQCFEFSSVLWHSQATGRTFALQNLFQLFRKVFFWRIRSNPYKKRSDVYKQQWVVIL